MAFYDAALSSKQLARIIADCYLLLGRRETIDLLDRMKDIGFRESTRSGLSFATDDLKTPSNKEAVLKKAAKEVEPVPPAVPRKGTSPTRSVTTRSSTCVTHARDEITKAHDG